jgi:hypothetical protein
MSQIEKSPVVDLVETRGHTTGAEWLSRYSSSLMGVFGTPQRVLVRGAGCLMPTARSTWTSSAASPSTHWATRTRS